MFRVRKLCYPCQRDMPARGSFIQIRGSILKVLQHSRFHDDIDGVEQAGNVAQNGEQNGNLRTVHTTSQSCDYVRDTDTVHQSTKAKRSFVCIETTTHVAANQYAHKVLLKMKPHPQDKSLLLPHRTERVKARSESGYHKSCNEEEEEEESYPKLAAALPLHEHTCPQQAGTQVTRQDSQWHGLPVWGLGVQIVWSPFQEHGL